MSTEPFSCTAGLNFAVADAAGDVFLCTNFMRGPERRPLGNLYTGIALGGGLFPCTQAFCICPQHKFDERLHLKAHRPGALRARRLPYDLWLHWYVTEECFLSCVYCEAGNRPFAKRNVCSIDTEALLATLQRLGRTVHLSFTGGGEPFAVPNMTEACSRITERHYISFNSNLLGIDMADFLDRIDTRKLLYIQASLHLHELERTRNVERFTANVRACRKAGVTTNVVAVGIPSVIPDVPRYRALFASQGVRFTFAPYSGEYEGRRYPDAYTDEELRALGMPPRTARTHEVGAPPLRSLAGRLFDLVRPAR